MFKRNLNFKGFLIPRYIIGATIPYILLSLLLLTAVLFAQQAARLAELIIYVDLPFSVLGGIGAALLPGVLIFSIRAPVHWWDVLLLAPATLVGGYLGARLASVLPEAVLRWAVVLLGLAVAVYLFRNPS